MKKYDLFFLFLFCVYFFAFPYLSGRVGFQSSTHSVLRSHGRFILSILPVTIFSLFRNCSVFSPAKRSGAEEPTRTPKKKGKKKQAKLQR
jgi:hypothetical protein